MKIAKKLLAYALSATMLCSLTGCKEQEGTANSGSDATSNSSVVEEQPKEFSEVLADMAKVENFNFSTNVTANYNDVTYNFAFDEDGDASESDAGKTVTPKTFKLAFNGSVNGNGGFALKDFTVDADLTGEGNKTYQLIDIVACDEKVYVNVKPLVNIVKEFNGEEGMPPVLNDVGYVVITEEDVQKYGDMFASQTLPSDTSTGESNTEGDVDEEALKKAASDITKVATDFVKNLYEQNKSLIVCEGNTYTLSINNNNYKTYVDIIKKMIDDGSLKKFVEDVTTPLSGISGVKIEGLEDLDASLTELKTELDELEVPSEFDLTYTLTAPKGDTKDYTVSVSMTSKDEDGNKTEVKATNVIVPTDGTAITAPENAMTLDELMQKMQEQMGGSSGLPSESDIDISFGEVLPINQTVLNTVA